MQVGILEETLSGREPTRTPLVPGACLLLFLAILLVDGPESPGLLLYLLLCALMVALVSFEDTSRPARSMRWSAVLLTVVGSQIALVLMLVLVLMLMLVLMLVLVWIGGVPVRV